MINILYIYLFLGFVNIYTILFYNNSTKYILNESSNDNINNDVTNNNVNNNVNNNDVNSDDNNNNQSMINNNDDNKEIYNINLARLYQICICVLLLFNPIYYFINNSDVNNIGFIFYKFNYIAFFIFLFINFKQIIKYKYLNNINFNNILMISQFLILIIYGISVFLSHKYDHLFLSNFLIINILLHISEFYGTYIYINSIILFILIFVKLLQDIILLNRNIEENIEKNNKKGLINYFYKIINLKNTVTYTINDFNYILNIFTLINVFSLGLIYHKYSQLSENQKIYFYILSGFFVVIEGTCLSIIISITKTRQNIFNKIYNPLFINNFIKKYDLNTFNDTFDIELDLTNIDINNTTIFNLLEENSTSIDWIILNITLNSKWVDFDLFGIKIYSINCITKIIAITAVFYKIINL